MIFVSFPTHYAVGYPSILFPCKQCSCCDIFAEMYCKKRILFSTVTGVAFIPQSISFLFTKADFLAIQLRAAGEAGLGA